MRARSARARASRSASISRSVAPTEGGQRRADLVADGGQEERLGGVGLLELAQHPLGLGDVLGDPVHADDLAGDDHRDRRCTGCRRSRRRRAATRASMTWGSPAMATVEAVLDRGPV